MKISFRLVLIGVFLLAILGVFAPSIGKDYPIVYQFLILGAFLIILGFLLNLLERFR
jgi:hypothetical protein